MPLGATRERLLYGILSKRKTQRYALIRWGIGIVCTAAIGWLAFSGTLRFDLWGGHHMLLGEERPLLGVAKAFAFPFLAVNILIIVGNRLYGRYLCGFVCPIGGLARAVEWARFRDRKGQPRIFGPIGLLLICLLLSSIVFTFWVDWRVFAQGTPLAIGLSGSFLLGMTAGLFGLIQFLGLRFCREYCPSGVYFAVLGQDTCNGVEFVNPDSCTDCGVCELLCPMDLSPREMSGGAYRSERGFYGEGLGNFALCIRCGDCVVGCEGVGSSKAEAPALRMGFLPADARDSRPAVEATQRGES